MSDEMDFSAAAEKVQEMFSNEEGRRQIQDILSMFGGDNNAEEKEMPKNDFGFENIEMMMKIQEVMSVMNNAQTSRQAAFLKSLAPLLRPERREKVDSAVRFLSIGKAINAFKNI